MTLPADPHARARAIGAAKNPARRPPVDDDDSPQTPVVAHFAACLRDYQAFGWPDARLLGDADKLLTDAIEWMRAGAYREARNAATRAAAAFSIVHERRSLTVAVILTPP